MVKLRSVVQKISSSSLLWRSYFNDKDHSFTGIGRKIGWFLRIVISGGLIFWLFSRYNLQEVLQSLKDLPLRLFLLACLAYLAAQILSSLRWQVLCGLFSFLGKFRTFLGFYFVGMFFNLFLPTGLGGDFFKIHFLSRKNGRRLSAAFTVLGDRVFGLMSMLLMGSACVKMRPDLLPPPLSDILFACGLAVLAGLLFLPVIARIKLPFWPGLSLCLKDLAAIWQKPKKLVLIFGLSFLLQALGMGAAAILGAGLGIQVPVSFYFAAIPIVSLAVLVPISLNGIGIREGALVYLLGFKGIPAAPALCLGLLFFAVQAVVGLLGGAAYLAGFHRRDMPPETRNLKPENQDVTSSLP